jgi:exopolysaccharide production protein ExoZ
VYKSLQTCRAAAAVAVVLFHIGAELALPKTFGVEWLGDLFRFGRAGVDFFFVLSGFIIVTAHRNDFFRPARLLVYIRKRVTRIYPVYWIIFATVFGVAWLLPSTRAALPHDPGLVARALALMPLDQTVVGGTGAPVIVTAWSLQYELVFYSIVGLFIWGRVAAGLVVLALVANAALCSVGTDVCRYPASFFASPYFLLFGLGALVALLTRASSIPGLIARPGYVAALGALGFTLTAVVETITLAPLGSHLSMVAYGFSSAAIIYGLVEAEKGGWVLGARSTIQIFGDASYSLYLLHFAVLSILFKLMLQTGLKGTSGALVTLVVVFIGCLLSSLAFHVWIERPLMQWLSVSRRNHLANLNAGTASPVQPD